MTSGCKDIEIRKLFFGSIFTKLATKYNIIEFNKSDIKRSKESMQPRVLFYTWVEFCISILVVGLKFTKVSVFFSLDELQAFSRIYFSLVLVLLNMIS